MPTERQDAGYEKRILTSQIGCEESRKSTTDDTSDKCTGRGNAVNRICVVAEDLYEVLRAEYGTVTLETSPDDKD